MPHAVTAAGTSRILQVWVNTAAADGQRMASIGHELQHVTEVLRDTSLNSNAALYFFYAREGRHTGGSGDPLGPWETERAVETGLRVLDELRLDATETCPPPGRLRPGGLSAAVTPGVLRK
jgi:hypothetical protein